MRRLIIYFSLGLSLVSLLSACYKEPFFNEKSFMVGKWQLVRVQTVGAISFEGVYSEFDDHVIQKNLTFEVEEKGVWYEFVDGEKINRWRIFSSVLEKKLNDDKDIITIIFSDRLFGNDDDRNSVLSIFELNTSRDTLISRVYPPPSLYKHPQGTYLGSQVSLQPSPFFTFVKIE